MKRKKPKRKNAKKLVKRVKLPALVVLPEQEAVVPNLPESNQVITRAPVMPDPDHGKVSAIDPPASTLKYLRFAAGVFYTTSMSGCSLVDMQKHPIFGVVAETTLRYWSLKDRWAERRKVIHQHWHDRISTVLGTKLVAARRRDLEGMERLRDIGFARLEAEGEKLLKSNSWEGLATVILKMMELMDKWREELAKEILPTSIVEGTSTTSSPMAAPRLSKDEARAAALTIIQMRRAQIAGGDAPIESTALMVMPVPGDDHAGS